ncbi:site-specific integrase [Reichenbachiella sp. MALMAid0571]|uniref:site-specific integrase n=1 Tax=Reichenbachiella sp. MALMAid0571 TaxID=3143939 RepID=UPI0032DEA7C9
MGHSVTPVINRNNIKTKSGLYNIDIRVIINRKPKYFSTDQKLALKYWSGKTDKWVKESHPHNFELNKIIGDKVNAINGFIYRLTAMGHVVDLKAIADFMNKRNFSNTLNAYIENYFKDPKVKFNSMNTIKKYKTFQMHLNNYNSSIPLRAINEPMLQDFGRYLTGLGLSGSTVIKYFDPFKKIVKHAVKHGYLEKDPFYEVDLGAKRSKPKRDHLEIEEILELINVQLPEDRLDLEDTRKHWLMCFFAGFYYSDLRKLKWDEIKSSDLGYVIVGSRFKNEQGYIVPVHKFKHAIAIIEGQKGLDPEYVFPDLISDQKYNDKLKILAKLAGIGRNLNNKMARHSSIQFWESRGIETQFVAVRPGILTKGPLSTTTNSQPGISMPGLKNLTSESWAYRKDRMVWDTSQIWTLAIN